MGSKEITAFLDGEYGPWPDMALGSRLQARRASEYGDRDLGFALSLTREEVALLVFLFRSQAPSRFIDAVETILFNRDHPRG